MRQCANDRTTRKNSFQKKIIGKKEHEKWFLSILRQVDKNMAFIFCGPNRIRLGIVRFSRTRLSQKKWEIHFTISPRMRGKGFAKPMIIRGLLALNKIAPESVLLARVKKENERSLRVLQSLGFRPMAPKNSAHGGVRLFLRLGHFPLRASKNRIAPNDGF